MRKDKRKGAVSRSFWYSISPDPSCARRSGRRHSEGEALGGETENLLQIKQFSILRFSKGAVFSSMYVTAHLIDFITVILRVL